MMDFEVMKTKPATLLIVGAGAVKNSWNPIIRVMEKKFPNIPLTADMTNCLFATLIHQLRDRTSKHAMPSNLLSLGLGLMKEIREALGKEIALSQETKELSVQEEFNAIADKFLFRDMELLALLTTNWDTIVDDALLKLSEGKVRPFIPLHIHGIYNDPTHLYLPTEAAWDPFRSDKEQEHHTLQHDIALGMLPMASKIVIYGLSLSPLDAELLHILSIAINNKKLQSIYIIDPDHKTVAGRARTLRIKQKNLVIKGIHPSNLDECFDYSIRISN